MTSLSEKLKTRDRSQRDALSFLQIAILNLSECHKRHHRGAVLLSFAPELIDFVTRVDDLSLENPFDIVMQYEEFAEQGENDNWLLTSPYGPVLISATFCSRGLKALSAKLDEKAWTYVADAMYWCGIAVSNKAIDEVLTENAKKVVEERARAAGQMRNEKYVPVREKVYQLAVDMRPESGWDSRKKAAKAIQADVLRFAQEVNCPLIEEGSERTIYDWLRKMPDPDNNLFPSRVKKA